jgi:tetratricopeptide (TPR) repeat protein
MKATLTTILLFLFTLSFSQNYKTLVGEADVFYKNKEYKKSVEKYNEAFSIEQKSPEDLYNAACSAALLGNKKVAFQWLQLALNKGWSNVNHLTSDTDLKSLHNDKKWPILVSDMQKVVDAREAKYDKPLQAKLLALFEEDQTIRKEYIKAQKDYGNQSKIVDSLGKVMMHKDSINLGKVTEILDKYGWVGVDKVGGQANQTLFLVIQHSDLKKQQKYLPMMREAVKNNNASSSALALLEDRVALGEGKKQIYGSQIGYDNETNTEYVLPLEDPDNVDKRRATVGLGPLADYVKRWNIIWNVEEYKKQLPEIEAKSKR